MEIAAEQSMYGAAGDPLDYPSTRPDHPFLLDGAAAHRVVWLWDRDRSVLEDGRRLDEVLASRGAASVEDRVVQVAFGANRDLGNVAWKFSRGRGGHAHSASSVLVALPGFIHDADVVACNVGYWGYVYAALALHRPPELSRPYLAGNRVPVTVLLLDRKQMAAMHVSEGVPEPSVTERRHVSCDVGVVDVEVLGRTLHAQVYGLPLPFLSLDGGRRPVGFRRVRTAGPRGEMARLTQFELWEALLDKLSERLEPIVGTATVDDVVATLRAGGGTRMSGGSDSRDHGQRLYETIRTGIIEQLAVIDADGTPATGSKCLPRLESTERGWTFAPLLRPQLAQRS